MTNLPFGFSAGDGSDDENNPRPGGGGFDPNSFDLTQLGNMFSQLGQMISQAGQYEHGTGTNYELAKQHAVAALGSAHPASSIDVDQVRQSVELAEVWLDGATGFPAASRTSTAWSPRQWVEQTLPSWKQLCDPITEQMSTAWNLLTDPSSSQLTDSLRGQLPDETINQLAPMLKMMGSLSGMSISTQLGQGLSQLAGQVLTSTDIGIPLGPEHTAALLPTAMVQFAQGLSLDVDQVRLYLAAREAAHHRLYAAAPWLRDRVISLVRSHAAAVKFDLSEVDSLLADFDPTDHAKLQELMTGKGLAQNMFEPKVSPGQEAARESLETLLALIEGWVDTVVTDALGDRLPGAVAIREALRRRRAAGGPGEQTFARLVGLDIRPERLRAAAALWEAVGQSRDSDDRDALWAHPDLLPTAADLADPQAFVQRDKEFAELLAGLDDIESLADLGFDDAPPSVEPVGEGSSAEPQAAPSDDAEPGRPDSSNEDPDDLNSGK